MDDRTYQAGQRFRVVKPGAHLIGWKADRPNSSVGWQHQLDVGDQIEVANVGFGVGSDPGWGTHWRNPSGEAGVFGLHFSPAIGGMWNYRPDPTFLEEIA